jgi:hypothetical protein
VQRLRVAQLAQTGCNNHAREANVSFHLKQIGEIAIIVRDRRRKVTLIRDVLRTPRLLNTRPRLSYFLLRQYAADALVA